MDEERSIVKDDPRFLQYLDFATLRNEGIGYIASFSGKVWTDHNLHDPGITILEALCYVLTDLDYRTRLDFKNLVAKKDGDEDNFYTPAQILGNNPLTIADYRKLLIDLNGVRNAWIEKMDVADNTLYWNMTANKLECNSSSRQTLDIPLNGLYKVYIEPDDVYASAYIKDACGVESFPIDSVLEEINKRLNGHRNLCEDFAEVYILKEQLISLCLHIDLKPEADPEAVLIKIFATIQKFFSPAPAFYSLQEMLKKNKTVDEIFEGRPYNFDTKEPSQKQGFIDTAELEELERHKEIHASDLYRIIMDVEGVTGITRLVMDDDSHTQTGEWSLPIKMHHRPVFSAKDSTVVFYKNRLPFTVDISKVQSQFIKSLSEPGKFKRKSDELDFIVPEGDASLNLAEYKSVQYEFPELYYIGKNTVPANEKIQRKVQTLQLQAYLLFYDRLLADYLSQLSGIRKLFALSATSSGNGQTWFPSLKPDIPLLPSLLRGYGPQSKGGCNGPPYTGMPLAFVPLDIGDISNEDRKTWPEVYLRDEAAGEMISFFSNSPTDAFIETWQDDDAYYHFYIRNDGQKVLLKGYDRFRDDITARQTARDVIFMASLALSYYSVNNPEQKQYSYDVIYNEAAYAEVTKILYESKTEYQQRKEGILNHLLSRFSEDFTEYSLMMYALNGNKSDPDRSLQDKQNLLTSYAEVSAGRARAFDYRLNRQLLPVTGLQKRVAAMMGIPETAGTSLSNFSLLSLENTPRFFYYLPGTVEGNTPLFETTSVFGINEKQAVEDWIELLAADKFNYRKYGCEEEKVFGFYLQGRKGGEDTQQLITAKYVVEYDTAEKRNLVMDWLITLFKKGGRYTELVKANEGYYFSLKNERGTVNFRSIEGFQTTEQADVACYYCLNMLQKIDAYKIWSRTETSDFMIQVVDLKQASTPVIAKHPYLFGTKEAAEKTLNALWQYYQQKSLLYEEESTVLYGWQLLYKDSPAWLSDFVLQEKKELPAAFMQFLQLASDEKNYQPFKTKEGKWMAHVIQNEADPENGKDIINSIARQNQFYDSIDKLQEALKGYVALFAKMLLQVNDAVTKVEAAQYSLINPEEPIQPAVMLNILAPVPEGMEGERYIGHIKTLITNGNRLSVNSSEKSGGCYSVVLTEEDGTPLAESPVFLDYAAAEKLKSDIFMLGTKLLLKEVKGQQEGGYDIIWKDENNNPLFKAARLFETSADALISLLEMLLQLTRLKIEPVHDAYYGYGFNILHAGGHLHARQYAWVQTAEERDGIMANVLRTIQVTLQETNFKTQLSHNYFFQVKNKETKQVLLEGPEPFGNFEAVEHAFYTSVKQGKIETNYQRTSDGCSYGFLVLDESHKTVAVHPFVYSTATARDETLRKLIEYLKEHGAIFSTEYLAGSWHFQWQWLSCSRLPEIALQASQEIYEEAEAQYELERTIQLAGDEHNYKISQVNEGWQVKLLDMEMEGNPSIAFHPSFFNTEKCAAFFIRKMVEWAKNHFYITAATVSSPISPLKEPANSGEEGYRLWNRRFSIATNTIVFDDTSSRDRYIELLAKKNQYRLPKYSIPDPGEAAVIEKNSLFCFRLNYSGKELWRSVAAFETKEAALQAFEQQYISILLTASDSGNYNAWQPQAAQLILYNGHHEPLAVFESYFENKDAFDTAIQERIKSAHLFPLYQVQKKYGFRLYNPLKLVYEWKSTKLYNDPKSAINDFTLFLKLLQYAGNYIAHNESLNCSYTIVLGKVLLDITNDPGKTATSDSNEPKVNLAILRENFLNFLENLPGDDSIFYTYMNYEACCSYSFRLVHPKKYRLARHTKWFDSLGAREKRRMQLVADVECKAVVVKPGAVDWKPKLNGDGYYFFQLKYDNVVVWEGLQSYTDECAATTDDYYYIDILELAGAAQAYWYEPISGMPDAYRLWLKDVDGKIVAKAPDIICGSDKVKDMATRMRNARSYPVVRNGDGFTFEINDSWKDSTIWEGINNYPAPSDALKAYDIAVNLLADVRNYQRTEEGNCGRFGIELTDPSKVFGCHPLNYATNQEKEVAVAEVKATLNSEGFHVIEHILLRPVKQAQRVGVQQLKLPLVMAGGKKDKTIELKIIAETFFDDSSKENENQQFIKRLAEAIDNNGVYPEKIREGYNINFRNSSQELVATARLNAEAIPRGKKLAGKEKQSDLSWLRDFLLPVLQDALKSPEGLERLVNLTVKSEAGNSCPGILTVCPPSSFSIPPASQGITEEDTARCERSFEVDPYSFWATIVVPAWPARFKSTKFRDFFESTLRTEAPSHIKLRIVWVSPADMDRFEMAYLTWLTAFSRKESCDYQKSLTAFATVLMQLQNVFPAASLLDEGSGEGRVVVLDETAIG